MKQAQRFTAIWARGVVPSPSTHPFGRRRAIPRQPSFRRRLFMRRAGRRQRKQEIPAPLIPRFAPTSAFPARINRLPPLVPSAALGGEGVPTPLDDEDHIVFILVTKSLALPSPCHSFFRLGRVRLPRLFCSQNVPLGLPYEILFGWVLALIINLLALRQRISGTSSLINL